MIFLTFANINGIGLLPLPLMCVSYLFQCFDFCLSSCTREWYESSAVVSAIQL